MEHHMFPDVSKDLVQEPRELAPEIYSASSAFGKRMVADGALR